MGNHPKMRLGTHITIISAIVSGILIGSLLLLFSGYVNDNPSYSLLLQLAASCSAIVLLGLQFKSFLSAREHVQELEKKIIDLAEEQPGLKTIFDNAPVEMYLKDAEGRYVLINRRFEELFNVTNEELKGKFPDSAHYEELGNSSRDHDKEVLTTGKLVIRNEEADTSQGHRILNTIKFPIIDKTNTVTGLGAVVTDVTDLKEAELAYRESTQRLDAVLQNAPLAIHLKDLESRYVMVNTAFEHMFSCSREDIIGKTYQELQGNRISTDDVDTIAETESRVIKTGMPVTFEHPVVINGKATFLETIKFPVINEEGEVFGIGGIETDISERHTMMNTLEIAKTDAEKASRAKSEFLANMSHELRTPLNAIIGFSTLIKEEFFGPIGSSKYLDYTSDIHHSGEHLLEIINDILDVSSIEAGALELVEENVELNEIIKSSINLVMHQAKEGQASVTPYADDFNFILHADRLRIKQILLNLLSNAVKFTPEDGEVSVKTSKNKKGEVEISVIDTGIGMDDKEQAIALKEFGQVDGSFSRKYQGTGLGLPLTKKLIEMHGGKIEIKSRKGEGTTIIVCFPKKRVMRSA